MLKFFRKRYQQLYRLTNNQHGFSLVEVLAAVIILSMISIAFARFSIVSLQAVNFNKQRQEAFQLARQEAMAVSNNDSSLAPPSPDSINGVNYTVTANPPTVSPADSNLEANLITVTWPSDNGVGTNNVALTVYTSKGGTSPGSFAVGSNSTLSAKTIYVNGDLGVSSSSVTVNYILLNSPFPSWASPAVYTTGTVTGLPTGSYQVNPSLVAQNMTWTAPADPYSADYQNAVNGVTSQGVAGQTLPLNSLNGKNAYTSDWYLGDVNATGNVTLSSGNFIVDGNVTVQSGDTLEVSSGNLLIGGSLTIDSGAQVVVDSGTLCVEGAATINNGTLTVSSGNAFVGGDLSSTASTITVSSQSLMVGGAYSQSGGTTNISSNQLYVNTTNSSSAHFSLSNGGSINLSSGNMYSDAPVVLNNGTVALSSGNIYIN